jgi:hypothetical protein
MSGLGACYPFLDVHYRDDNSGMSPSIAYLQDFDPPVQVSVLMMFLWKAQLALRLGVGGPNTRLSKTLWI